MRRTMHLADLTLAEPPRRPQLVEGLRTRLCEVVPGLRLIAEGVLGADSRIDFVGVEPTGRVVLILVGEEGDDLELIGRAVAQRAWVEPRIRDWIQLAPNLGMRPGAGVRTVLLCPSFRHETEAAAAALGDQAVSLVTLHRSKGLDYEIMYLPCLWEDASSRGPLTEPAQDETKARGPIRFFDEESRLRTLDLGGPDYAKHLERTQQETLAEQLRLL